MEVDPKVIGVELGRVVYLNMRRRKIESRIVFIVIAILSNYINY